MINITSLDLSHNNISILHPDIGKLINLVSINLGNNKICELPNTVKNLKQLQTINLDNNDICEIPGIVLEMEWVKDLYLTHNVNIYSFPIIEKLYVKTELMIHLNNDPSLVMIWNHIKSNYSELISLKIVWNMVFPDHVIGNLYIGGIKSVITDYVYERFNIQSIFTMAKELSPLILTNMQHILCHLDDSFDQPIPFDKLDLLHMHLKQGGCIVHCFMGISRSAGFIIAYLMKYYNFRLDEAYNFLKNKRCNIQPNNGFWNQLVKFDSELFNDCSVKDYSKTRYHVA